MPVTLGQALANVTKEFLGPTIREQLRQRFEIFSKVRDSWESVERQALGKLSLRADGTTLNSGWYHRWLIKLSRGGMGQFTQVDASIINDLGAAQTYSSSALNSFAPRATDMVLPAYTMTEVGLAQHMGTIAIPYNLMGAFDSLSSQVVSILEGAVMDSAEMHTVREALTFTSPNPTWCEVVRSANSYGNTFSASVAQAGKDIEGNTDSSKITIRQLHLEDSIYRLIPGLSVDVHQIAYGTFVIDSSDYTGIVAKAIGGGSASVGFVVSRVDEENGLVELCTKDGSSAGSFFSAKTGTNMNSFLILTLQRSATFTGWDSTGGPVVETLTQLVKGSNSSLGTQPANEEATLSLYNAFNEILRQCMVQNLPPGKVSGYGADGIFSFVKPLLYSNWTSLGYTATPQHGVGGSGKDMGFVPQRFYGIPLSRVPWYIPVYNGNVGAYLTEALFNNVMTHAIARFRGYADGPPTILTTPGVLNGIASYLVTTGKLSTASGAEALVNLTAELEQAGRNIRWGGARMNISWPGLGNIDIISDVTFRRRSVVLLNTDRDLVRLTVPPLKGAGHQARFPQDVQFVMAMQGGSIWAFTRNSSGGIGRLLEAPYLVIYNYKHANPAAVWLRNCYEAMGTAV